MNTNQDQKTCLVARLGAIFLLAVLVRVAPFGLYITPDEPIWILRSVHFADAVAARDATMIPQTGHPGMTTMALGALGVRLMQIVTPAKAAEHLAWIHTMTWLAPENDAAFTHLAFFLPMSRMCVILVTSLAIAGVYILARQRMGEHAARCLALFLALDPFLAGLSGLLHTDALQATFALLAILWLLPNRRHAHMLSLAASALCLALAGMTKMLGYLIAPGLALTLLIKGRSPWARRWLHVTALTLMTMGFTLVLYPPFWYDPRSALHTLTRAVGYHESLGLREVFFLGQMSPDPGWLFYPVVLLFRLSPPVLLGVIMVGYKRITHASKSNVTYTWFVLPALFYLLGISIATKKFDRYALSAMTLLSALAAQFWAQRSKRRQYILGVALLLSWVIVAPLPLYYANPLLGGPWLARKLIPLGWGEASGLAASRANQMLAEAETRTLLTTNVPGAAPFFSGTTLSWEEADISCVDSWISTDEDITYDSQRVVAETLHLAGIPLTTLYTQSPAWPTELLLVWPGPLPGRACSAWVAPRADNMTLKSALAHQLPVGTRFTWVQAPACYPLTTAQLKTIFRAPAVHCDSVTGTLELPTARCVVKRDLPETASYQARFAGKLDLIATVWPEAVQAPDALAVQLRWQPQAALDNYSIYLALRDAENTVWSEGGNVLVDVRYWPASAWDIDETVDSTAYVPLPLHMPPGVYTLTLTLFDSANRQLGLTLPDATFGGIQLPLGEVKLVTSPYPAPALDMAKEMDVRFPGLRLIGATPPPDMLWSGDSLTFSLGWERIPGDVENALHWDLMCGEKLQDAGELPIASTVQTWPLGHRYVTHHSLRVGRYLDLSAEELCTLRVSVGKTRLVAIATLRIRSRDYSLEFPQSPQIAQDVIVGDFANLSGVDLSARLLSPGETLSIALYWKARGAAAQDYTIFVHLVGPDGRTWAQSDGWPAQGTAPTTSWVAQQAILDYHTLNIPDNAPPGDYEIFVGIYDAIQGLRVPLYGPQRQHIPNDRALVGTIRITP